MSGYTDGRRAEWDVVHALTADGYDTVRAASSKGACDVVGFKPGQVVFVNVKRTTPPGPTERADLLRLAALLPDVAVPIVALHPRREPLTFRRLTGPGPRDWTTWTPDSIGDEQ